MPVYCAYIVGLHDRPIGVVQMDYVDDNWPRAEHPYITSHFLRHVGCDAAHQVMQATRPQR